MNKWITSSDLCSWWKINRYNLAELVFNGKLQAHYGDDLSAILIVDGRTLLQSRDGYVIGERQIPLIPGDVADCIFLISDVEKFERENGIAPNGLPTDLTQQGLSDEKPMPKPRKALVCDEAARLRRDYPKMNKVEVKRRIDNILESHNYPPYSRTQFNRLIKALGFPKAPRGRKPTNKKK